MIKQALVAAALLAIAGVAVAQTDCSKPVLKALRNNQEIPATGSALFPGVTLRVTAAAECPAQVSYRFTNADLTLIHHGRPALPTMRVSEPKVDLRALLSVYQPGDRIYIFIPYTSLVVVTADGKLQPYPQPKRAQSKRAQLDLSTEEAKGISFNWLLQK